ncbi:Annexin [Pseudovirgaria hyperparasitica]|uniref:Annexin n=1 Tax=Pseudovirgaria hyperparasitica TaxID=470096 RepID=A0A6A6W7T0_9PEZI|nr:Annexin [Pseudovirgaria hyperparasitica]KAF2757637.1 Annexin [Pseudovirgaria hyperparasitica]
MSHQYPPPGGYPGYPPSQSHPPQPGYNQQPYVQQPYTQPGYQQPGQHSQYPPQPQYTQVPPQAQYPPVHPQGQYAPAPQYAPGPPQGQYVQPGYSQHQGYAPPAQYEAPPAQGQGQYPPSQQQPYGAPPGHYYGVPPPGQHGAPQGQWGVPPGAPTPPTLGYIQGQMAPYEMTVKLPIIYKALRGSIGIDEKALIGTLSKLDPLQIAKLRADYDTECKQRLETEKLSKTCDSKTGDPQTHDYLILDIKAHAVFGKLSKSLETLIAIVQGPLTHDVEVLDNALVGIGTKESALDDVLVGRSNADMNAIKAHYQGTKKKSLESNLRSDLSAATEEMFMIIISARRNEDSIPVDLHQAREDAKALRHAMTGIKNQVQFCNILLLKNDAQVRAIAYEFQNQFSQKLVDAIKKQFSGHMEATLMLFVNRAVDRVESDAVQLEETMKGLGTRDTMLMNRVVRMHWNRQHMHAVKDRFIKLYGKTLRKRIESETSGDFEKILVACIE